MSKLLHAIVLVDTAEVKRLGSKKLSALLTPRELAYCAWNKHRSAEHIAARLAAKRAFLKILPKTPWLEMEIHKEESGQPFFQFKGKTAAALKTRKINQIHLSLSHTEDEALASLICL